MKRRAAGPSKDPYYYGSVAICSKRLADVIDDEIMKSCLVEVGKILDSLPIATGERYVWNPLTLELVKVWVDDSVNR